MALGFLPANFLPNYAVFARTPSHPQLFALALIAIVNLTEMEMTKIGCVDLLAVASVTVALVAEAPASGPAASSSFTAAQPLEPPMELAWPPFLPSACRRIIIENKE